ncbi:MAG: leader peptidase (prepilin peptidase) / N-methyltransferase, partial [Acidimicrobiaceae bacterium]
PLPRSAQIAVALVNAALWAADTNKFGTWWAVVPYAFVFSALLAVSVVDLRLFRIPDRIVFPSLLVTTVLLVASAARLHQLGWMKYALVGLVTYFSILFLFHIVSPRGMGFGDVKLALLMGLSLGWLGGSFFNAVYLVLIALFLGCILGIIFGLVMRLVKGKGGAFPFGPALALSCIYVILTFEKYLTSL